MPAKCEKQGSLHVLPCPSTTAVESRVGFKFQAMAAIGAAAALAAGGAIGIIAYQTESCCYPPSAARVPVKKRASTATSLMGEVLCHIPGMMSKTRRHVTLVGDMLMHGSVPGHAEGSIFLRGAVVSLAGSEVRVMKEGEASIAIFLENEDEAEFWAEGLTSAITTSDSLPKLFSMHNREMQSLGKRNEEFASQNHHISKMLSLKRREFCEVERKAQNYEHVADMRQQEVQDLQARLADFTKLATAKETEMRRIREEVEAEKQRLRDERLKIEGQAASATAEAASRRNEVAELFTEVVNAETEAYEKEKKLKHLQKAHFEKSHQMEEVQKRLLSMQKLLEQSEAPSGRRSTCALDSWTGKVCLHPSLLAT
ncbi:unnamed protein product [Effrenium voratum]|nr:unnamed protein product [Effrenium voratum]